MLISPIFTFQKYYKKRFFGTNLILKKWGEIFFPKKIKIHAIEC